MSRRYQAILDTFLVFSVCVLLGHAYVAYSTWKIRWVATESIPKGLYFAAAVKAGEPLYRGQSICWTGFLGGLYSDRAYVDSKIPLCKEVWGLPGDGLQSDEKRVAVLGPQGQIFIERPVRDTDSKGRAMEHPTVGVTSVPSGHLFVLSPYTERGLDSRYIGFLPREQVKLKLKPVFTLKNGR